MFPRRRKERSAAAQMQAVKPKLAVKLFARQRQILHGRWLCHLHLLDLQI